MLKFSFKFILQTYNPNEDVRTIELHVLNLFLGDKKTFL